MEGDIDNEFTDCYGIKTLKTRRYYKFLQHNSQRLYVN